MKPHLAGHRPCQAAGEHVCSEPSGRRCVECGDAAGTPWGPYFCPDCDSERLQRVRADLERLAAEFRAYEEDNE